MSTDDRHIREIERQDARRLRAHTARHQLEILNPLFRVQEAYYLTQMRNQRRAHDTEAALNMMDRLVALDDLERDLKHTLAVGDTAEQKLARLDADARSDTNG